MAYYPDATWINQPRGIPLERTLLSNIDFAVSHRSFVFDLSPWDDEQPNDDSGQPLGSGLTVGRLPHPSSELSLSWSVGGSSSRRAGIIKTPTAMTPTRWMPVIHRSN